MTHETVLLDLDRLASTTYNIMQTVIAVNAIDSQREGAVSIVVTIGTLGNLTGLSTGLPFQPPGWWRSTGMLSRLG